METSVNSGTFDVYVIKIDKQNGVKSGSSIGAQNFNMSPYIASQGMTYGQGDFFFAGHSPGYITAYQTEEHNYFASFVYKVDFDKYQYCI